jgi:hypothetical protein
MLTIIHFSAVDVVTVLVATLGVGLPESCRMSSRGFYWLHLHFQVGVGFPISCLVANRGSPALNMASFGGIATLGVRCPSLFAVVSGGSPVVNAASFGGVGFPISCPVATRGASVLIWRLLSSRLLASGLQRRVRWHSEVHLCQIWRRDVRRRYSIVVSNCIRRLSCFICGVFWNRRDDRCRDAWRPFFNDVSNGISRLICP